MELSSYVTRWFSTLHAGMVGSLKAGRLPKHTAGARDTKPQTRIQIYVKIQGAMAPVKVDLAWTGSIAVDRIQSQLMKPSNVTLRFRGQRLSSHLTLKESGIELGSVLHMVAVNGANSAQPMFSSSEHCGLHFDTTAPKGHATIRGSTRHQQKDIRIYVKTTGAPGLVAVYVDLGWTVSCAADSITSQLPELIDVKSYNLRFRGHVLSSHKSLKESGIEIGSVILVEPQKDSRKVTNSNLDRCRVVSM